MGQLTVTAVVRLTPEQREKLAAVAAADGRPASGWLRWQIVKEYERLEKAGKLGEGRESAHDG